MDILYLPKDTIVIQRGLEVYKYSWKYEGYHRQWMRGGLKDDPRIVLFNIVCRPVKCALYTDLWTPQEIEITKEIDYEDYIT